MNAAPCALDSCPNNLWPQFRSSVLSLTHSTQPQETARVMKWYFSLLKPALFHPDKGQDWSIWEMSLNESEREEVLGFMEHLVDNPGAVGEWLGQAEPAMAEILHAHALDGGALSATLDDQKTLSDDEHSTSPSSSMSGTNSGDGNAGWGEVNGYTVAPRGLQLVCVLADDQE